MRRIWYSRAYQILHEGRILHAKFALAVPYGFSDVPWIKDASGVWLRCSRPMPGDFGDGMPIADALALAVVPLGMGARGLWGGLEVG